MKNAPALLASLLFCFCVSAYGKELPSSNCDLKTINPEAARVKGFGAHYGVLIFPPQLPERYTGCQLIFAPHSKELPMDKAMTLKFHNGKLEQLEIESWIRNDEALICVYNESDGYLNKSLSSASGCMATAQETTKQLTD
jgi:hypothetical protein